MDQRRTANRPPLPKLDNGPACEPRIPGAPFGRPRPPARDKKEHRAGSGRDQRTANHRKIEQNLDKNLRRNGHNFKIEHCLLIHGITQQGVIEELDSPNDDIGWRAPVAP